jgi:hypothetical protein
MNAVVLLRRLRSRGFVFRLVGDSAQVRGGNGEIDKAATLALLREHKAAIATVLRAEASPVVMMVQEALGAELVAVRTPAEAMLLQSADRVLALDFRGRRSNAL